MKKTLLCALCVLCGSSAFAQTTPVTFAWDANPNPDNGQPVAGYKLLVDQQELDAGNVLTVVVPLAPGPHRATLRAYWADGTPSPQSAPPLTFTVQGGPDPSCLPPLGAHAPAIFPTSPTLTTGKPGSRSFMNYQLGGADAITEVAIQIDGVDTAVGRGDDLRAFSGMWFLQPVVGTHTLGVRVLTAFGCALVRPAAPLIVRP